ncbi:MAG: hypothetical protein RIM23_10560 [Coleofasciculus sp. G3-WIS-01]|uniref:hypothetical protein n=1 Tax=Coleofasciculus sp. G3-WIS-01 TaxID=3069528 RepID=UPI0032F96FD2
MNRLLNTQLIFALAGASISFLAGVEPGITQPEQYCDDPGSIPAAETTRNLELDKFGVELTIPSNFRAMLLNNGNVKIVDPGTYELLSCIAKGRKALGRGYAQTLVRTVENPRNLELRQLVEQKSRENEKISPYSFDGKQGYLVEQRSRDVVAIPDAHAEFWVDTNDVPGAVVISKSCDCSGMSESLVSLLERSSLLNSSQASTP